MVLFSVSSNVRASGGHPVSARICATRRSKPCSRSCTAERFTATRNVASAGCDARHCTRARQACCSTCSPMGTMSPVSSASPRKPAATAVRDRDRASAAGLRRRSPGRQRHRGWAGNALRIHHDRRPRDAPRGECDTESIDIDIGPRSWRMTECVTKRQHTGDGRVHPAPATLVFLAVHVRVGGVDEILCRPRPAETLLPPILASTVSDSSSSSGMVRSASMMLSLTNATSRRLVTSGAARRTRRPQARRHRTAHALQQAGCHGLEQEIAQRMTAGVIDGFEAIEIHEQQSGLAVVALPKASAFELVHEQLTIGQPRQRVVRGAVCRPPAPPPARRGAAVARWQTPAAGPARRSRWWPCRHIPGRPPAGPQRQYIVQRRGVHDDGNERRGCVRRPPWRCRRRREARGPEHGIGRGVHQGPDGLGHRAAAQEFHSVPSRRRSPDSVSAAWAASWSAISRRRRDGAGPAEDAVRHSRNGRGRGIPDGLQAGTSWGTWDVPRVISDLAIRYL